MRRKPKGGETPNPPIGGGWLENDPTEIDKENPGYDPGLPLVVTDKKQDTEAVDLLNPHHHDAAEDVEHLEQSKADYAIDQIVKLGKSRGSQGKPAMVWSVEERQGVRKSSKFNGRTQNGEAVTVDAQKVLDKLLKYVDDSGELKSVKDRSGAAIMERNGTYSVFIRSANPRDTYAFDALITSLAAVPPKSHAWSSEASHDPQRGHEK